MLKNISDYLSFTTLLTISIYGFYVFLMSIVSRETEDNSRDRRTLLRDYINNEEE